MFRLTQSHWYALSGIDVLALSVLYVLQHLKILIGSIVLEEISVTFEHCYGIKNLKHKFDLKSGRPIIIYAPNGVMKSSFAKTFQDFSNDVISKDRIHTDRTTVRTIEAQLGTELSPEQIFVIEPYVQGYESNRISTLLVNAELKKEYDKIYEGVGEKLTQLLTEIKTISGIRKDVEALFTADFGLPTKEIFTALGRLEREVVKGSNPDFATIKYSDVFNAKILAFVGKPDFAAKLAEYTGVYDQLIGTSKFFKKGIFNHNNASVVANNLKQNGWFDSGHSVTMNSTKEANSIELKSEDALKELVQAEKDSILTDGKLTSSFEKIDKELLKNAELRTFRDFLANNPSLASEFNDVGAFKQKVWIAYLNNYLSQYTLLMAEHDTAEKRLAEIVDQAKKEATNWLRVIEIFNERFSVPFIVRMDNQDDVILKREKPSLKFEFQDGEDGATVPVEEAKLLEVLSNGEKRALYILNIIFDVEARKRSHQETIFIVDDIADSFDYKNKYAIIEYLKDIASHSEFHQILLTHNFDFFRTASSRLGAVREQKLHSIKTPEQIKLVQEKYQNNPFTHWKGHTDNPKMLLASIPFVRNLAEFSGYPEAELALTSLLHIKPADDTETTTIGELQDTFNSVLGEDVDLSSHGSDSSVFQLLLNSCQDICLSTEEVVDLEDKIVLAMGIRLSAEKFMISKIADPQFVKAITRAQTYELTNKYKENFPQNHEEIRVLERVSILTPENIHVNSFMYEPILDMANDALKKLFRQVQGLSPT